MLVGFLTGVGIQVAFGQIGGMLGLEGTGHRTLGKIVGDLQHIGETNLYALTADMRRRQESYIAKSLPVTPEVVEGWTWRQRLWNNAFAMKTLVENLVSGLILRLERTIKRGDVLCTSNGEIVQVEKIGPRATIVRTKDDADRIIPNYRRGVSEIAVAVAVRARIRSTAELDERVQEI